jgi:hypothetical protein
MNKRNLRYIFILLLSSLACDLPFYMVNDQTTPTATLRPIVVQGTQVGSPISINQTPFTFTWENREPFRANLAESEQSVLQQLPGATIYHLALSIEDPPVRMLGLEVIHYTNTETTSLEEVDLALFPQLLGGKLDINSVLLEDSPIAPIYDDWLMRLPLPEPLHPGESVTFTIEFDVTIPSGGGDFYYGIFGYNNGILSLAHAYPTVLVYNEQGWNNQTPDLDGDPLFADTSFFLVSIDAPSDLELVTTGVRLECSENAGRQKVLIADGPARDFYLAASANWVKQSHITGEVTINTYSSPRAVSAAKTAIEFAVAAIETFSERYGSYPYTEFDIAPIITTAGGVEYPGMTSISEDAYALGVSLEIIVVHETAHMWFYNLVGNDTLDQPWLDESLAQFATWQYYLDCYGQQQADIYAQANLQSTWDLAEYPDTPIGLPVSSYPGYDYVSIIYGRGALFMMALRDQMGIPAFDRFMQEYVRRYSWGISSTDKFKTLAEDVCHCDLTPLFVDWVYP